MLSHWSGPTFSEFHPVDVVTEALRILRHNRCAALRHAGAPP